MIDLWYKRFAKLVTIIFLRSSTVNIRVLKSQALSMKHLKEF